MRWILVPLALAAGADAAMAFAPTSSFTPAARRTANACRAAPRSARLRSSTVKMNQMEWQEIFDETYQAPYYWNEKTGETVWDKPAAMSAPAAASAPPATEEISQEEYAELLRLAGQPAAAQPAAAAKPAGGGGMFGGMFGGAAARSGGGGGLISPGNPVAAKPKAAVVAKPRQQAAAMFDDDDYLTELPPVSKQDKPQTQQQRAAQMFDDDDGMTELPPVSKQDKPQTQQQRAAAAPRGGGGFLGGLFGGNKGNTAAPQSSVEEVSESELRELMAAAGTDDIQGYSLKEKSGYEGGTRVKVKESAGAPKPSASSMAAAPTNTGVTDLGGVKVTTIRKGMPGEYPQPGDQLTMHYVGKIRATKQIFDSSIVRGPPLDFVIGQGQVIRGWDEGILQMTLGEKAQLVIQAEYGYGAGGKGAIPPNSDLVFDVDLLAINGVKPSGRYAGGN